ncbi:MAG TPA: methylmalonyl-CoA mutase [Clostridiales bacterium]|nr:methylmalonyl-CoA mutase [Clostridiales bacterium]
MAGRESEAGTREGAGRRPVRVLVAKPGLDGHDRGAKVVARALRDAGMEVVYTGLRQTPETIAQAAVDEDVDVVGLSSLSGAHRVLFPRVVQELRKRGRGDVLVIGGGIIPAADVAALEEAGVRAVFGPGSSTSEIVDFIRKALAGRDRGEVVGEE